MSRKSKSDKHDEWSKWLYWLVKGISKSNLLGTRSFFIHSPQTKALQSFRLQSFVVFEGDQVGSMDPYRCFGQIPKSLEKYNIHYSNYHNSGGFKFIPDSKVFEDIDSISEVVYKIKN